MFNKFLNNSSGWDYADLSHITKLFGGPQKLLNAVLKTGRVQGIVGLLILETGVVAISLGAMNLHSTMINGKNGRDIITNSYVDCPKCGTRLVHRSGLSNADGHLECPNCNSVGCQPPDFQI